jgi:hypothetical protein
MKRPTVARIPTLPSLTRRAALVIGAADLVTAALVAYGVFVGLPARWWPVDTAAAGLATLQLASGVGLLAGTPWAVRAARAAGVVALAVGLLAVSVLALTASWLSGIYGPVGRGGAIVLAFVAALVLPYLVVLPIMQLLWLYPNAGALAGGKSPTGS